VTVRGPSLPVNGTLLARQASPDPAIGRIGNELAGAMDPTALAALGAIIRIGSGWTGVVDRSFLDGPHTALNCNPNCNLRSIGTGKSARTVGCWS